MHDIDPSKSLFGLLESRVDVFLVLDIDLNDEELVRTVFRLVLYHGFRLADGSDDDVSFSE
jgi:hypothetical protein